MTNDPWPAAQDGGNTVVRPRQKQQNNRPKKNNRNKPKQQKRPNQNNRQQNNQPRPNNQNRQRPQQQQRPQSNNNRNNFNNNNRNNFNNNNNAEQKPYVRCPSAMLCIKRENCDFNGVITEQTLNLTPGRVTESAFLFVCFEWYPGTKANNILDCLKYFLE